MINPGTENSDAWSRIAILQLYNMLKKWMYISSQSYLCKPL